MGGLASIISAPVEVVRHSMHLPCSKSLAEDMLLPKCLVTTVVHTQLTENQLGRFAHDLTLYSIQTKSTIRLLKAVPPNAVHAHGIHGPQTV